MTWIEDCGAEVYQYARIQAESSARVPCEGSNLCGQSRCGELVKWFAKDREQIQHWVVEG